MRRATATRKHATGGVGRRLEQGREKGEGWFPRNVWFPMVLGFRKNEEVLLHMHNAKMASLDLNSQQMEASLNSNSQEIELHVVDVGVDLLSVRSYVEGLVFLDKAVNVCSKSDVKNPIDSIEEPPAMAGIVFLEVYRHSNTDMFPKKSIPAAVAVNLAEEMGIVRHDIEVTQESENAYRMLDIVMVDPLANVEPQLALITTPKVEFLQYNGRLTGRAVVQLTIEKGDDEVGGEPRKTAFSPLSAIILHVTDGAYDGTKLSCTNQAIISENDTGKNGYRVPLEIMPSGQFEPLMANCRFFLYLFMELLPWRTVMSLRNILRHIKFSSIYTVKEMYVHFKVPSNSMLLSTPHIPQTLSKELFPYLWKIYQTLFIGKVYGTCSQGMGCGNVYIVRKRSRGGKRFGFVRMKDKENVDRVIERLHVFFLYGARLTIKVASKGYDWKRKHANKSQIHGADLFGSERVDFDKSCKVEAMVPRVSTTEEYPGRENMKRISEHVENEELWNLRDA
ncbi:hypothetical protein GQ457_02G032510 [Hibiscus cannabinus]